MHCLLSSHGSSFLATDAGLVVESSEGDLEDEIAASQV